MSNNKFKDMALKTLNEDAARDRRLNAARKKAEKLNNPTSDASSSPIIPSVDFSAVKEGDTIDVSFVNSIAGETKTIGCLVSRNALSYNDIFSGELVKLYFMSFYQIGVFWQFAKGLLDNEESFDSATGLIDFCAIFYALNEQKGLLDDDEFYDYLFEFETGKIDLLETDEYKKIRRKFAMMSRPQLTGWYQVIILVTKLQPVEFEKK